MKRRLAILMLIHSAPLAFPAGMRAGRGLAEPRKVDGHGTITGCR